MYASTFITCFLKFLLAILLFYVCHFWEFQNLKFYQSESVDLFKSTGFENTIKYFVTID